jgi:hypothetical protein
MMTTHKLPPYEEVMKLINADTQPSSEKTQLAQKHQPSKKSRLEWGPKDISVLFEKHQEMGNKWTTIAKCFPSKTENIIKNFFYSSVRKLCRKIKKGILPKFDDPKCILNVEQYSHLLDYIMDIFTPDCPHKRSRRRDSYLVGMLDTKELSLSLVEAYKEKLMAYANMLPSCKRASEMGLIERSPLLIMPHKAIQQKLKEIEWYLLKTGKTTIWTI